MVRPQRSSRLRLNSSWPRLDCRRRHRLLMPQPPIRPQHRADRQQALIILHLRPRPRHRHRRPPPQITTIIVVQSSAIDRRRTDRAVAVIVGMAAIVDIIIIITITVGLVRPPGDRIAPLRIIAMRPTQAQRRHRTRRKCRLALASEPKWHDAATVRQRRRRQALRAAHRPAQPTSFSVCFNCPPPLNHHRITTATTTTLQPHRLARIAAVEALDSSIWAVGLRPPTTSTRT